MRLLLVLLLLTGLWAAPLHAQAPASETDAFEVKDIAADVTADSAAHARDQAITEAQRTAFTQLLTQLGADPAIAAKLSNDDIATLVQNFEVQNERSSSVRYIGTFTVQFRPTAVRNFLTKKGAHFTEAHAPAAGAADPIGDLLAVSSAAPPPVPPVGPTSHLNATAPIATLAEWARLRQKIIATPGVSGIDVISMQRGAVLVDIRFGGGIDDLRKSLNAQNIALEQDPANGTWIVHE